MLRPGKLRRRSNRLRFDISSLQEAFQKVFKKAAACILLSLSLWVLGCGRTETPSEPEATPPLRVQTFAAEIDAFHVETKVWGRLQAGMETRLSAQVSGVVSQVSDQLYSGEFVSAGEILVRIDAQDYRLALVQSEAQLAAAKLHWHQEQAEAKAAAAEWQLRQAIQPESTRPESTRPESTQPPTQHELANRKPQLAEAEARLDAAHAALEKARLDLRRTELRAPYSAWVTARHVEPGQFVRVGETLAEIQSTSFLEARLPVSRRDLRWIEERLESVRVTLYSQAGSESIPFATVRPDRIEPEIDPETALGHLVVRINRPAPAGKQPARSPLQRAGELVAARISLEDPHEGFWIPRSALVEDSSVVIADSDGLLERRRVHIAADRDSWLAVDSGLQPGDWVCHAPPPWVVDGMRIDPERLDAPELFELVGSPPPSPPEAARAEEPETAETETAETETAEPEAEEPDPTKTLLNEPDPTQETPAPGVDSRVTPPRTAARAILEDWTIDAEGGLLRIRLIGAGIKAPRVFALEQPNRWVVDLKGSFWPHAPAFREIASASFRRARLAQFQNDDPAIARLVIELEQQADAPSIELSAGGLEIVFEVPP